MPSRATWPWRAATPSAGSRRPRFCPCRARGRHCFSPTGRHGPEGGQAHEDGREAVVVRLGEKLPGIAADQRRLIRLVTDPHRDDVGPRHPRLPRVDSLEPYPRETLLLALV